MKNRKTIQKPLDEDFVKHSIIQYLSNKGWGTKLKFGTKSERGEDIRVRHNKYGRYFIIETKGDGTKRTNSKDEVNFVYGLGQLITRMTTIKNGYYFGLGLPEKSAKKAIRRIHHKIANELKLHLFSVNDEGKVTEYKPSDLKKYQLK